MSGSEFEQEHNEQELQSIAGKPKNVEISALRTIEAYKESYRQKGMVPSSKDDYPRSDVGYRQVQRLLKFDSIVKKEKGIKKVIRSMVVQPVTVEGKTKLALYYTGEYIGKNAWDNEIYCSFNQGYYFKPKLQFVVVDTANPFDPQTGEKRGTYKPAGYSYEHYIFVPEEPKARRKFLEELIKESPGTEIANCIFSFRQPTMTTITQVNTTMLVGITFVILVLNNCQNCSLSVTTKKVLISRIKTDTLLVIETVRYRP